ncbi:MAG: glycosyltransferase [Nitrospirae bacterium]|nr:glycosyltransferase [Nitrospirota bacterium]
MKEIRKINILFIIDTLCGKGGTENHLYHLVRNLNRDRFKCFIVAFKLNRTFTDKITAAGIPVYYIPVERCYSPYAILQALKIGRIIKENHIDLVQTFHFVSDTYGTFFSRLFGVKHIISSRRDIGDTKKARHIFINRIVNKCIEKFITVCDAVGERISTDENIPAGKQKTIYNGVDLGKYKIADSELVATSRRKLGFSSDDFVVGTVAHFRPEKNYDVFFKAVENAQGSIEHLRAIAVGQGPQLGTFKNYCRDRGLTEKVVFTGPVKDVREYISVMDVACLVPGSNEGFSNAVLEKMAMGKPLIVTDMGGNAEAVKDGENGIVIPPLDPGKLTAAITYLYRNPSVRMDMGRKSRERAELLFSMEKMIMNHERFYRGIFNGTT